MPARSRPHTAPQAVSRIWLVRARDHGTKAFASLAGAARYSADLTNKLRRELIEDNFKGVTEQDVPLATAQSFIHVLRILDDHFGYGNEFIAITEMGVFE